MRRIVAMVGCSVLALTACGSKTHSSSASSAKFCADARVLGSLGKGTQDAMAMSHAESSKDFTALATKVTALKANAPGNLAAAVTTVAARFTLEAKSEEMMTNANAASEETQMLADHKTGDDAAFSQLTTGVKSRCNIDIT